ncbi:hypothetical protein J4526_05275 [Desulfurococcaceae archaeon MEX13E-LK6-19]|nr:hypothetical protein J4526_05275 [Desulfurococcaceae archaeon MEX13E-LK6-19]
MLNLRKIPPEFIIGAVLATLVLLLGIYNTLQAQNITGSATYIQIQNTTTSAINNTTIINETTNIPRCIIYGLSTCPHCNALKRFFDENNITCEFRDVYSSNDYKNDFMIIIMKARLGPYVPTTIVLDTNNSVVAIVQGEISNIKFWRNLLNRTSNGTATVYVVSATKVESKWIIDTNATKIIQEAVLSSSNAGSSSNGGASNNIAPANEEELFGLMTSMFVLALVDSVNPCAISTAMIISANAIALGFSGKKKYLPLVMFVLGVYIGYFIVGYFASILAYHNIFLSIVIAFAIMLIARDIHRFRVGKITEEITCDERECLPGFLSKVPKWLFPTALLGFGAIISWSFMLCSAAPYILFVTLLSRTVTSEAVKIILIGVYCSIIVIPIILAGVASQFISKTILNIKKITAFRIIILIIISLIALSYLF